MRVFLLAALAVILSTISITSAEARRYKPAASDTSQWSEETQAQPRHERHRTTHARRHAPAEAKAEAVPFWELGSSSIYEQPRSHSRRHHRDDEGGSYSSAAESHSGIGARPGAWCGWYMRSRHGGGAEYNLAANWRHWGSPASRPQIGAIVVWSHHVGEIVGQAPNGQWIVLSGNDSHRVQSRARSVSGATFRVG